MRSLASSSCSVSIFFVALVVLATASGAFTLCNRVEYSGHIYATDICFRNKDFNVYMRFTCQKKTAFYYPFATNDSCSGPGYVQSLGPNTSWSCGGMTCGWTDAINCNLALKYEEEIARPLDYCDSYNGKTSERASYIYECCSDGKTIRQRSYQNSVTCGSDPNARLVLEFTYNSTCMSAKDNQGSGIVNVTQMVRNVVCNPLTMVNCTGISPGPTSHPTRTPTTAKPTRSPTPLKPTTTRPTNNSTTTTVRPTTSPTRANVTSTSTTTAKPTASPTPMKQNSTTTTTASPTKSPTKTSTLTSTTRKPTRSPTKSPTLSPSAINATVSPTVSPTANPTLNTTSAGKSNQTGTAPNRNTILFVVLIVVAVCCLCLGCVYWFRSSKDGGGSLNSGNAREPLNRSSLDYNDQEIDYVT